MMALPWVVLVASLAGCGHSPPRPRSSGDGRLWEFRHQNQAGVASPGPREVVVVINYNSPFGNHAGIWAGDLLADPAGSYLRFRHQERGWPGPSLPDYVRFQMEDGDRVLSYRFELPPAQFEAIRERVRSAGTTMPLFCAAAVQNMLAGVGPFATIPEVTWSSPAGLADQLSTLRNHPESPGACQWPDGAPC